MTENTKGWSFFKQTVDEVYQYLKRDRRLDNITEKQARTAVKYHVRFCNKFEGNKIPDTFAVHYISAIYKGPNATSFIVAFGDEVYLLTNGNLFNSIFDSNSYWMPGTQTNFHYSCTILPNLRLNTSVTIRFIKRIHFILIFYLANSNKFKKLMNCLKYLSCLSKKGYYGKI